MSSAFGEYRLLRLLGEGGMAQVWAAQRQLSGYSLECAVKIIKPDRASEPEQREMFVREGQLSLILSGHDNVVSVLDAGEHQGHPYLAMELIDGVTLAELARGVGRPWPVAEAVHVVAGILRALCHIHDLGEAQGIVHRDVTPHNVMISRRGEVKLMDFGIAQRADAEPSLAQALGKLGYVPREQVEGDPDPRTDLFSTGAVLFELLDGRRFRWHCADEDALFQEIYRERVPSLRRRDVPAPVLAVLRGLLQPHREHRIASAAEALRRLEAWEGFESDPRGLEALFAEAVDARRLPAQPEPAPRDPSSSQPVVADVPRPWDELRPTAEHPRSHPWLMAEDVRRSGRVPTQSHPRSVVAVDHTDEIVVAETEAERPSDDSAARAGARPSSRPAWADQPPPLRGGTSDEAVIESVATRVIPAARHDMQLGADTMERRLTLRRPAVPRERDIPLARNSAEIAVTEPRPSRRAPWAEGAEPVQYVPRRLIQSEPGAPTLRRRPYSSDDHDPFDRTGSVSPRARESAAMHEAAGDSDVVTGEIVSEEGLAEAFVPVSWRLDSPSMR